MSEGTSRDETLEAILKAQNDAFYNLPRLVNRPVLPPLAPKTTPSFLLKNETEDPSRPATSAESRPPTTSIGFPPLPLRPLAMKKLDPIPEKPKTPLYPIPRANISYSFNLNEIDETEVLRPHSVASTVDTSREFTKKVIRIPDTFSEFRELSVELDLISSEDIEKMKQASKLHDLHNSGYLSLQTILFAMESSVEYLSDTWQHLLDWLVATEMEEEKVSECPIDVIFLFDYQLFFEVVLNDKQSREVLINIPEVLESDDNGSVFSHLPSRPTSSQAQREQGRASLLMDLGVILANNPDINVERFKTATNKKTITIEELKMLLQIYGLAEHMEHLEQRIIECFLTHDQLFCFSAFVGCLNQINPAILNVKSLSPRLQPPKTPPWAKPPLPKLDDSGVIPDLDTSGSISHHNSSSFK